MSPSQRERYVQSRSFVQQLSSEAAQVEPTLSWQHVGVEPPQHWLPHSVQRWQMPSTHASPGSQHSPLQTVCPVRAAELFPVALTITAGVIAACCLAVGTTIRPTFTRSARAGASGPIPGLHARAFDRFGCRGRPARGFGIRSSQRRSGSSDPTHPEQPAQKSAPVATPAETARQLIESGTIHSRSLEVGRCGIASQNSPAEHRNREALDPQSFTKLTFLRSYGIKPMRINRPVPSICAPALTRPYQGALSSWMDPNSIGSHVVWPMARPVARCSKGCWGSAVSLPSPAQRTPRAVPTPTPKPVRCPGQQHWDGNQCACPDGSSRCGPDCCPNGQAECCDNACCYGQCYGEELCCPTGFSLCNGVCLDAGQCCSDADCTALDDPGNLRHWPLSWTESVSRATPALVSKRPVAAATAPVPICGSMATAATTANALAASATAKPTSASATPDCSSRWMWRRRRLRRYL